MIDIIEKCKLKGFTFGQALKHRGKNIFLFIIIIICNFLYHSNSLCLTDILLGPGPKYKLPDVPRGPSFSLKWRTKLRKSDVIPGPYYVKHIADAPAFTMYILILSDLHSLIVKIRI